LISCKGAWEDSQRLLVEPMPTRISALKSWDGMRKKVKMVFLQPFQRINDKAK